MASLKGLNMAREQWYIFWRAIRKCGRAEDWIGPSDPLAAKQERIDRIRACAVDGKVSVSVDQMDCDCSRWTSSRLVSATWVAVEYHYNELMYNAEGPIYGVWIDTPENGAAYHSRDLAMEAFEDGHPHSVSMARYDEDGPYDMGVSVGDLARDAKDPRDICS